MATVTFQLEDTGTDGEISMHVESDPPFDNTATAELTSAQILSLKMLEWVKDTLMEVHRAGASAGSGEEDEG